LSHFGDLVRKLRKEKGITLEAVAKKIGSHKGYVSGIENDKVNPPSVAIIKKFAKLFGQDARVLARLAWVDKAPEILREDAEKFLEWVERKEVTPQVKVPSPVETPPASPSPASAPKV
jgi:transcriptional regulator with XRE-family HTH domain